MGLLRQSGIDVSNVTYVKPGEFLEGAINLDTGDKFGVVYNENSYVAYFDHHEAGRNEVTSTAEIVYRTMVDLGLLEESLEMNRVVDFVTKIDNRQFPAEEFLRSAKTLLGLQRGLSFEQLLAYFTEHESPTKELSPEEFGRYGLKEVAEQQQAIVDEAMETLRKMEQEGKVVQTSYGSVVVNENSELRVGSSAAYIRHDGILHISPGISFAITFKEKNIDENIIREKLGERFQGKIIRNKMWIYNGDEPLHLTKQELVEALM